MPFLLRVLKLPVFFRAFWRLKTAFVKQLTPYDCGICCLAMIMRIRKMQPDIEMLRQFSGTTRAGTSMLGLKRCAGLLGLNPKALLFVTPADLLSDLPCILNTTDAAGRAHFVVLFAARKIRGEHIYLLADPASGILCRSGNGLAAMCPDLAVLVFKTERSPVKKMARGLISEFGILFDKKKVSFCLAAIALTAGLLVSLLGLSTALFVRALVDGLNWQNSKTLYIGIALFTATLVARAALIFLRQKIILSLSLTLSRDAAHSFLNKIFSQSGGFYRAHKSGELVTRLNDTQQAGQTYSIVLTAITDLLILSSLVAAMFVLVPAAGWACLAYSLLVILICRCCTGQILRAQGRIANLFSFTGKLLSERLEIVELLQEFSLEKYAVYAVEEGFMRWQQKARRFADRLNGFAAVLELLKSGLLIKVLFILTSSTSLTAGDFAAALTLVFSISPCLMRVWSNTLQFSECRNSFRRINELIPGATVHSDKANQLQITKVECIGLENIRIGYPGDEHLVSGLNAFWKKGRMIGLNGGCGTGKTSLMRCLTKFLEPVDGTITVNGIDLRNYDASSLRAEIGFVPQGLQLAGDSIAENLLMGRRAEPGELQAFWMDYGFDRFLNLDGKCTISAGQRKLLGFARALFKGPSLLLLDETTAMMDAGMEEFVFNTLEKIRAEKIVIFSTHKKDLLWHADEVLTFGG